MKKLLFALLFASSNAFAGAVPTSSTIQIITPDFATAHRAFSWSSLTADGDLVVCPYSEWYSRGGYCKDETSKNRWAKLKDMVPAGKTYAGYMIHPNSGSIYVFWK